MIQWTILTVEVQKLAITFQAIFRKIIVWLEQKCLGVRNFCRYLSQAPGYELNLTLLGIKSYNKASKCETYSVRILQIHGFELVLKTLEICGSLKFRDFVLILCGFSPTLYDTWFFFNGVQNKQTYKLKSKLYSVPAI